jgi:hypothetical protein
MDKLRTDLTPVPPSFTLKIEILPNTFNMICLLKGFNLRRGRRSGEVNNEIIDFNEEYKRCSF